MGLFPAVMPWNSIPILTVGTAFKPISGELYKKPPLAPKFARVKIKKNFAPTVLKFSAYGNSSTQLLILEPPLSGSHTSFLGNDPCSLSILRQLN